MPEDKAAAAVAAAKTAASVRRLATWIHDAMRTDMVNGYTGLSPRLSDGVSSMKVKDARTEKMLRVIVMEEE